MVTGHENIMHLSSDKSSNLTVLWPTTPWLGGNHSESGHT